MKYGKILVTISVVAAANSFVMGFGSSDATFSPDGSKVAYRPGSRKAIHTVNADGSGEIIIVPPGDAAGRPYFSPDGKKIAFVNEETKIPSYPLVGWNTYKNICVVDVDGKNLKQLTNCGYIPYAELTFSPDGRKVLYLSEEFGSRDIFAVNVDGTGKTRLTAFASNDESTPVFLPGGEEILFEAHGRRGEEAGIWVMNADGSGKKKLLGGARAKLVAVSPDGKKIAYAVREGEEYPTYVAALDGSGRFKIADENPWAFGLSFSADGKKVLYHLKARLYVVDADGSGRKALTPQWGIVNSPVFFARGAKVAFVGGRSSYPFPVNIWTMDADGSNLKLLEAAEGLGVWGIIVSPTGDKFFLESYSAGGTEYSVVNADGSRRARLYVKSGPLYELYGFDKSPFSDVVVDKFADFLVPPPSGPYGAKFSPDGAKIVYPSNEIRHRRIYTVNADGSAKVKFDLKEGVWGVPRFSPDGNKIAFINDDDFFRNRNIFLVDVDGTNLELLTAYGDDPFEGTPGFDERVGVLDEGLTFSPDGRRILYCSAEFGSKDIFAVNADGTGKTRLTAFAGWEIEPAFLAGGDKILFTTLFNDDEDEDGIWIMNADGSGKKRLPLPVYSKPVTLSSDGKKIAYEVVSGPEYGTYVANLDGSRRFKVTDVRPRDFDLSFSPDGKKVLYCLGGRVCIANADGSDRKALTPAWYYVSDPAFFTDGGKIVFSGARGWVEDPVNIFTVNADGSDLELFWAMEGMYVSDLVVSPTGDRFLFRVVYEGDMYGAFGDYFAVKADGTGLVRLTGE